ncbi:hypothetical protein U875_04100 [Pandoraea pnomenusa 3kgm]|nr:hypothetical protein U875_04100 [Pandoraea pnomenusa 3kgm]AHB78392.1 hypothetical protein X636_05345 [Pandoraea pnomenusa]
MARAGARAAGMGPGRRSGASGVASTGTAAGSCAAGAGVGVADMGTIIKVALKDIGPRRFSLRYPS